MKLKDLNLLKVGDSIQMAGAVYAGEGKMYLCMFPEDGGAILDVEGNDCVEFVSKNGERLIAETLDMDHEDWKEFLFQTDVMQTEILTKASDGTLAKAIVRKSQRQIDQNVSWKVFRRDGYKCRYCGADDVPLTVDHLVCWEAGGPSVEENLVSSCKKCNKIRSNTTYEEWLQHPHYKAQSKKLAPEVRAANEALVGTLTKVRKYVNVRSR